jgi:hypothetical protein
LRIVDLAAGTGSNMRYLSRHLPPIQHWRLVDRDAALLRAAGSATRWATVPSVHLIVRDLSNLAAVDDVFERASLVTASALLDLVADEWLGALAVRCRAAGAAALFGLTYDGRIECTPEDEDDEMVRSRVNEHQLRDKGFGPALGPNAAEAAARRFAAAGFTVERERSDWILDEEDAALQRQLIDGWARAAAEVDGDRAARIEAWARRRQALVHTPSAIVVGHEDLAAWLR